MYYVLPYHLKASGDKLGTAWNQDFSMSALVLETSYSIEGTGLLTDFSKGFQNSFFYES